MPCAHTCICAAADHIVWLVEVDTRLRAVRSVAHYIPTCCTSMRCLAQSQDRPPRRSLTTTSRSICAFGHSGWLDAVKESHHDDRHLHTECETPRTPGPPPQGIRWRQGCCLVPRCLRHVKEGTASLVHAPGVGSQPGLSAASSALRRTATCCSRLHRR
jgi:hypothetical protein